MRFRITCTCYRTKDYIPLYSSTSKSTLKAYVTSSDVDSLITSPSPTELLPSTVRQLPPIYLPIHPQPQRQPRRVKLLPRRPKSHHE